MSAIKNALIVRGGSAGLSVANALGRQGISCEVLDLHGESAGAAVTIQNRSIDGSGEPALLRHDAELAAPGKPRVRLVDVLPFERIDDAFAALSTGPLGTVGLSLSEAPA